MKKFKERLHGLPSFTPHILVLPGKVKYQGVPIRKPKDYYSKSLKCDDFRGLAISLILSKVFEYCLLYKSNYFLKTSDIQSGFKKALGCNHAIYSVRTIVESFVRKGSTVNLCAIDLSKAFDKVNLHAFLSN